MAKNGMNVLLLTVDTLRADHLRCYGYFRDTAPNIDALAADGVLFQDSFASGIATGPSYTCMITGKVCARTGYYITPFSVVNAPQLDDRIPTLAEVMLQNGYLTIAFDNMLAWRAHPKHFARGYNYYVNVGQQPIGRTERISTELLTHRMIQWLKVHAHEESPFFLLAHYWAPHTPYIQPEPYRTFFKHTPGDRGDLEIRKAAAGYEYVQGWGALGQMNEGETRFIRPYYDEFEEIISIDLYDGAIRYVDHYIGQLILALKELDLYNNTLIILTSDHGEALGQHGSWVHSLVYDHTIHIPLILTHPDLPKGKIVEGFVQHIDLFPTIQEMTGASEWPEVAYYSDDGDDFSVDGQSLLELLSGGPPIRDRVYVEGGSRRCVRTNQWKLIAHFGHNSDEMPVELYNIPEDPMEIRDLSLTDTTTAADMKEDLVAWVESYLGGKPDPAQDNPVSFTCEPGELEGRVFLR